MTVRDCLTTLAPSSSWRLIKAGPRKSPVQPHVWFAVSEAGSRVALKFFESADATNPGLRRVRREIAFCRAVDALAPHTPMRRSLPRLLASTETESFACLAVEYCDGARVDRAQRADFARHPHLALDWIRRGVRFLVELRECQDLRHALGVNDALTLTHGDFSHYNVLAPDRGQIFVLDWEDWSASDDGSEDVWHMIVLPTIAERSPRRSVQSFREHWIDGSEYARGALHLARSLLPARPEEQRSSLLHYLQGQEARCVDSPSLLEMFTNCRRELLKSEPDARPGDQ